ncbi:MAG TPA: cytochrome P450 [Chloroflexota bacterium]|nr:cytochrome P450 [Chloroflexota bacterium]
MNAYPFNPFAPDFIVNPYPVYRELQENCPVHWGMPVNPIMPGAWWFTRYADVQAILKDNRFGRDWQRVIPPEERAPIPDLFRPYYEMLGQWMLFQDPPDHTRLRTLVHKAFTPQAVARLRLRIQQIADDLLDQVEAKGEMDLIGDFAFPLPMTVIAEMLGIPPHERTNLREGTGAVVAGFDVRQDTAVARHASQIMPDFIAMLQSVIAERRLSPQDDILSDLIAAEEQGDRLSESELIAMCILLIGAGHETTVNLIGNGVLALLQNPDQLELLRENPGLVGTAVEEILRYDSPVQMTFRSVIEDVAIAGETIRRGQTVALILGAANRDTAVFTTPGRLDITRQEAGCLSFGGGIHYCVGAPLARLEGEVALATLLRRLPHIRLASDDFAWRPLIAFRGLQSLPLVI